MAVWVVVTRAKFTSLCPESASFSEKLPGSRWGGLAQGACGAHAGSYGSSVFLVAYAPPMGGSRHPLFCQIGLGQKPLKVTFVNDPMHRVYGEI